MATAADTLLPPPPPSMTRTKPNYERLACCYDCWANWEDPYLRAGFNMLDIQQNDAICDIGSATGRFLLRAGEATGENGRIVGIDLSQRMCQVARKRCEGMPCTWEVRNGDALSILQTSTSTTFDRIAMSFTLELFEDDDARHVAPCSGRATASRSWMHGRNLHVLRWQNDVVQHVLLFVLSRDVSLRSRLPSD